MAVLRTLAVACIAPFLLAGAESVQSVAQAAPLRSTIPPEHDCLSYLRPTASEYVDWRDTVAVEHCDRIKRLWRLSDYAMYGARPQFFDGYIEAVHLPRTLGVSMPLLRVVFPERVFFDTAQSELRPEAMEVVRIIARNLQLEPPDVALFVAGHADARGSRDYNLGLSVDRANAVAEAIARQGVNVASVWRIGFGEDMPLVAGETLEAYGQNRRVEFLFAGRPEVIATWLADEQLDMICQGRTATEIDRCRTSLTLRSDGYEVVEVASQARRVDPASGRPEVDPSSDIITINPTPTRRIRIDPVNRRSGPIQGM